VRPQRKLSRKDNGIAVGGRVEHGAPAADRAPAADHGPARAAVAAAVAIVRPWSPLVDRLQVILLVLLAFGLRKPENLDVNDPWWPADALWLVAFAVAFAGMIAERKSALRFLRASWPLLLFMGIVAASTIWSNAPQLTVRRSFALFGTTAIALHFVNRLGLRGFVESIAIAIATTAVVSVPLILFVPSYGLQEAPEGYAGAWQGVFFEKNQLGQAMALGVITVTALLEKARGVRRLLLIAALALFVGLLSGCQSAGAIGSVAIFAIAYPFFLWVRGKRSKQLAIRVTVIVTGVTAIALLSGFTLDAALGALGRDSTFTGRTEIWQACLDAIAKRPMLGYGYREFWDQSGDARYWIVPNADGWLADMAHNGFIEVVLDTGIVGLGLFAALLVLAFSRAAKFFWRGRDRLSAWPLFIMLDMVVENFTDRSFATQDSVFWIVFLAAFWFATDTTRRTPKHSDVLAQ
jgi:O-antigen ligase